MSGQDEYQVTLTRITAEPDRFGRFSPVVWFTPILRHQRQIVRISLPQMHDVRKNDYAVGDTVLLRLSGEYPILGHHLHRQNSDTRGHIDFEYCGPCSDKLIIMNGNYYCPDMTRSCPRVSYAILGYAMRPEVLDLPLTKIRDVLLQNELQMDLPTVLYLDEEQLVEGGFCDWKEGAPIADKLRQRTVQLFGNCPLDMKLLVQDRTLDALSINGLYRDDRRRLQANLHQGRWEWNNLPTVMTDIQFLRGCGIRTQDALTIAQNALTRSEELDALAREF